MDIWGGGGGGKGYDAPLSNYWGGGGWGAGPPATPPLPTPMLRNVYYDSSVKDFSIEKKCFTLNIVKRETLSLIQPLSQTVGIFRTDLSYFARVKMGIFIRISSAAICFVRHL